MHLLQRRLKKVHLDRRQTIELSGHWPGRSSRGSILARYLAIHCGRFETHHAKGITEHHSFLAMLFAGAKVSQFAALPQGQVEAPERVAAMINAMRDCGFGNCTNHYECQAACPKGIDVKFIARLNREFLKALFKAKAGTFTPIGE